MATNGSGVRAKLTSAECPPPSSAQPCWNSAHGSCSVPVALCYYRPPAAVAQKRTQRLCHGGAENPHVHPADGNRPNRPRGSGGEKKKEEVEST